MNNLTITTQYLPAAIEDLARFILVGQEKLISVKAEIRAITKLELAEDVRNQKMEEAQMVSEALLDAQVKIGEITDKLPKVSGGDRKSENFKLHRGMKFDSSELTSSPCNDKIETKEQVCAKLGFNRNQIHQFETLANNKDIVEQVKAEARENEDIPTRFRVLQLVKEKNKLVKPDVDPDFKYHASRSINEAIGNASAVQVDNERLSCWFCSLKDSAEHDFQLLMIDDAIRNLQVIKAYLTKQKAR
ncbi:hypothetical protein [Sporomusa aerivorans]|uniref:hypothetical protein n=1 Tax=Sporomusa aerivorans TaxID=204936 RepID=UPI00352B3F6D